MQGDWWTIRRERGCSFHRVSIKRLCNFRYNEGFNAPRRPSLVAVSRNYTARPMASRSDLTQWCTYRYPGIKKLMQPAIWIRSISSLILMTGIRPRRGTHPNLKNKPYYTDRDKKTVSTDGHRNLSIKRWDTDSLKVITETCPAIEDVSQKRWDWSKYVKTRHMALAIRF